MKRVGILGSAFNPPHYGHLHLVERAASFLSLDEVILVPTARAPHKAIEELWGYEIRSLMAGVAFFVWSPEELKYRLETISAFSSSDIEVILARYRCFYQVHVPPYTLWEIEKERSGPSYTIDTLRKYRSAHPHDELYLLIGQDQAALFSTWKEYEKIFDIAHVCVATRPGKYTLPNMPFLFLPPFEEKASSSSLREAWKTGHPLDEFVPPWLRILLEKLRSIQ